MQDRWREEITERARALWTKERRHALFGDKTLALDPVTDAPLLRVLDLLQRDGSMNAGSVRKFMQVAHMLVLLEPPLRDLIAAKPRVRVLDVGCGSSALTLVLAWAFAHRWSHPAEIAGIDRRAVVIEKSRERAEALGLSVRFEQRDAADLGDDRYDAVLALHACDTATDAALAFAVRAEASLIAAAPCCHAELSRAWSDERMAGDLAPIWTSPHLRREAAATMTDALRTTLLRAHGYKTTAMEFVPSEHTPKNTMIRAVRASARDPAAHAEYEALKAALSAPALALERALSA